jgi:PPOX class probable F420-dependent enzyme
VTYAWSVAIIEPGSAPAERLASTHLAWLTTVRRDGQPQSSYVWFHHDGRDILVASQPGAVKLRNIRANPKVSFHLDGDTDGGKVLSIEGTAEVIDGEPPPERIAGYLAKYDEVIRTRLQSTPEVLHRDYSVGISIRPTRVRAW